MIKERTGIDAVLTPGGPGQFDVLANGKVIAGRGGNMLVRFLGGGFPDPERVIAVLQAGA